MTKAEAKTCARCRVSITQNPGPGRPFLWCRHCIARRRRFQHAGYNRRRYWADPEWRQLRREQRVADYWRKKTEGAPQ